MVLTLGNAVAAGTDTTALADGRMWAAKHLAVEDGTMTRLKGFIDRGQEAFVCYVYGPGTAHQPGALLGYAVYNAGGGGATGTTAIDIPIVGSFAAGAVWIGAAVPTNFGGHLEAVDGAGAVGTYQGESVAKLGNSLAGGEVPPGTFPTQDFTDDRNFRLWVEYTAAGGGQGKIGYGYGIGVNPGASRRRDV